MKDIMECSDDYLMLKLPINQAVRVDLTHQPEETIEHDEEQEGYRYIFYEYITKISQEYQRLLNFINNTEGKNVIHGNCPTCKVETYYEVEQGCELDRRMLSPILCRYMEDDIGDDECNIPDADEVMKDKAESLIRKAKFFDKNFTCPKCGNIYRASFALEYHETETEMVLIKIGQYPSLQEFAVIDFKGFNKVLDSLKIKTDYRNAIRNHINGDNIAAYVYLRRIVEQIVRESFLNNKEKLNISDEEFDRYRTKEKISVLKDYLPKFLHDNKEIYSVVSAGIHSLDEQQCERYYDIIINAIDIMLHQEEARREEAEMMKKTTIGIQTAVGEINV